MLAEGEFRLSGQCLSCQHNISTKRCNVEDAPMFPKFPRGVLSKSWLKISQLPSAASLQIRSRDSEPFL